MTNVNCGLTVKNPGSAPCPMLIIEYKTMLLYFRSSNTRHKFSNNIHTRKSLSLCCDILVI